MATETPAVGCALLDTLKRSARALHDAGVPFALGGGFAVYAWGGIMPEHDVDLFLREQDVDTALSVMGSLGFRTERPPEEWLVKAWDGDLLVDLIFRPAGFVVDDRLLSSAVRLEVGAVSMPVLSPTTLLAMRVLAMNEHYCDFTRLLLPARMLRERVDWTELAARVSSCPYGRAFLVLVAELGIEPEAARVAVPVEDRDGMAALPAAFGRRAPAAPPPVLDLRHRRTS